MLALQQLARRSAFARTIPTLRRLTTLAEEARISKIRPRRALFYVPGSDERKIHKSITLPADCIVYDLEDGVAFNKKGQARQNIIDALEASEHGKAEKAVRINAVGSGLELDDLNVVLHSTRLQAIVIPKVQSAKDVQFVSKLIDSVAPESHRGNIRLIASIESALGVENLKEIAMCDERLDALIFAAEDYCADLGLIRTPSRREMLYARQAVVTTAVAHGLQAIDLVCLDFDDEQVLLEECIEGRQWGFTGKQAIHPKQIDIIQRTYLPDSKDIERAARIVDAYEEFSQKGVGAFALDGKVIDLPVVKWASKVLARARAAGIEIPNTAAKPDNTNDK